MHPPRTTTSTNDTKYRHTDTLAFFEKSDEFFKKKDIHGYVKENANDSGTIIMFSFGVKVGILM